MKPLASITRDEARDIRGLLFDLDDTLLTHGVLTREAYGALWDMHDAGLVLACVTGRPSGWGEVIARQWPIDGAVTENGAIVVVKDGAGVKVLDPHDGAERRTRRARLARVIDRVREVTPEIALADDVDARRSDVTWDIGERGKIPAERVYIARSAILEMGARTTQSSVHLHATFDATDKAAGAVRFLASERGIDEGLALARYAFIGDSGNDAASFSAFRMTFGVANVRAYATALHVTPRWIASETCGKGFAEVARAILSAR